ncbi:hypothetical protein SeLEV6574_g00242 [Synchytrium endobioticum]|uniref:Uncharacterized protein n=1 Tax=Synchytrium endobioticum TaxID=286115 RepID=A0A507DKX4_9FUNG|nr:hypothetical protein SeLEV6574_g00242 [Synchytrium endobioticum]
MKQAADDGRKKMSKSFYEKLDRLIRRSFPVNDDVKTGLAFDFDLAKGVFFNFDEGKVLDPPDRSGDAKSRYVLDDSPRRYVRTPSFKTNGLVLSLLWIDTTSKPPPPDRKVEDVINLPNIFHNKTLRSTHRDAWIIAIDPGATCIAGAVAFDPKHPNQRRNPAVTTKSLAEPERRYRDWLEANKPEEISAAERECTKSDQETWAAFLRRFVTSCDKARAHYSTIGIGDFSSTKSRHVLYPQAPVTWIYHPRDALVVRSLCRCQLCAACIAVVATSGITEM